MAGANGSAEVARQVEDELAVHNEVISRFLEVPGDHLVWQVLSVSELLAVLENKGAGEA